MIINSSEMEFRLLDHESESYIFPRRFIFVLMCFFCVAINYADRTNISIAVINMAEEFGWTNTDKGIVLSSFYFGYVFSGIPGGYIADKYGGKRVLLFASMCWSLFTLLTPVCAQHSFVSLIVVRVFLGVAEGVAYPCIHSMMSVWIPFSERSQAISFFTSGFAVGTIATTVSCPILIIQSGWTSSFYIFGSLGILWNICWAVFSSNRPEEDPRITYSELKYIQTLMYINPTNQNMVISPYYEDNDLIQEDGSIKIRSSDDDVPWNIILFSKPLWAIYLNMFAAGWGFFVLLSWMPEYFMQEMQVKLDDIPYYTVLPYICQGLVGPISGYISDKLLLYFSPFKMCTIMQMISLLGPVIFFALLGFTHVNSLIATIYLTLALSLNACSSSGVLVYHLLIIPEYAGTVFGIGNSLSIIPAIVGVLFTGKTIDSVNSWTTIFILGIVCFGIGVLSWAFLTGSNKLLEKSSHEIIDTDIVTSKNRY